MEKFIRNIKLSLQQAYGNITIKVPELPPNRTFQEHAEDRDLVPELIATVEQWTATIKETVEREEAKRKEKNKVCESPSKETEYWRTRNATFNTLNQQLSMPQVKDILNIMRLVQQKDGFDLSNYLKEYDEFVKQQAIARDFVKFLLTLERQFKIISEGHLL